MKPIKFFSAGALTALTLLTMSCNKDLPIETQSVGPSSVQVLALSPMRMAGVVGRSVETTPTVRLTYQSGIPLGGVQVEFTVTSGGGRVGKPSTATNPEGLADAGEWVLGPTPGDGELAVSVGGSVRLRFTATAADTVYGGPPELRSIRMVFARSTGGNNIAHLYTMNGDGSDLRQLTDGSFNDSYPCVSPDGTRIAFTRDGDVHVMNADGTSIRRLTTEGGWNSAWSPDGTKIVFGGRGGLFVISAEGGSGLARLTAPGPADADYDPKWSPDGRQIAFTRFEGDYLGIGDPFTLVWMVNAEGTGETRIGRREDSRTWASWTPVWSPDGSKIALAGPAASGQGVRPAIFVMNRDGTGAVELAVPPAPVVRALLGDWSHDGNWIAFSVDEQDIYVVRVTGGTVRVTADGRSSRPAFFPGSGSNGVSAIHK